MWMTGFDVPSCSTLYLDKPMRNHTLMQTIARANRVFPEKEAGLIVDYVGVFRHLERALAIYGGGRGGGASPAEDKAALIAGIRESLKEAEAFCREQGVELDAIERKQGFRRLEALADAVDALVATAETKSRFLAMAGAVDRLFRAVLPDVRAQEFRPRVKLLSMLAGRIRSLDPPADISLTMKQVEALLDESIESGGCSSSRRNSTRRIGALFARNSTRRSSPSSTSGRSGDDRGAPGRRAPWFLHAGSLSAEGECRVPARLRELPGRREERP